MQFQSSQSSTAARMAKTDDSSQANHTLTGEFRHHAGFHSSFLANNRDVVVYLPPGYLDSKSHEGEAKRFPVFYLHDGQNLFDTATAFNGVEWGVDETAQQLILRGRIEALIIVAIYNTGADRIDEYAPTVDPRQKRGGKADLYGRFLIEELKPFIDQNYRTLAGPEFTGLGGSSLGGLVSLYLGLKHPNVFSKLMVMSPSVWWDHGMILHYVQHLRAKPTTRIWLDIGSKEGKFTPGYVRQLRDLLIAQGWRLEADLKFLEIRGGQHSEAAWAKRVEPALRFLFPKQQPIR
ncbi:MAG: alpha/beta hydrolase [Acidobacteria bacterium]|nr:alpha/beta hydrolase [Acidobacteriota bacterium]